jgi:hypothetical protein
LFVVVPEHCDGHLPQTLVADVLLYQQTLAVECQLSKNNCMFLYLISLLKVGLNISSDFI